MTPTKEQIDEQCRLMNNQLETLRTYRGAHIHECRSLMNWFVNQVPNIQAFYKLGRMDKVVEIYNYNIKMMEKTSKFIHDNIL